MYYKSRNIFLLVGLEQFYFRYDTSFIFTFYSCEKEGRCTLVKSNGTTNNKCGPKVTGE